MKWTIRLLPIMLAFVLMSYSNKAFAQPCDTCTSVWSANTTTTVTFSIPSMPWCTYKAYIVYRTRICNGYTQIDMVSHVLEDLNPAGSGCDLHCIHTPALRKAMYNHLLTTVGAGIGTTVVVAEPSPCYYLGTIDIPAGADICFGFTPGNKLYVTVPCDDNGCCYKELTPVGSSTYYQTVINSTPCPPTPYTPPSATIEWACDILGGGFATFNARFYPDTPIVCQITCVDGYAKPTNIKNVGEDKTISALQAYPNPIGDEVNVRFYASKQVEISIDILDIAGKVIKHRTYKTSTGMQQVPIGTMSLPSGVYTLRVGDGIEEQTIKIVK